MMQNLAIVVPARGGSKRIPDKNIVLLGGRPLLCYTLEAARASQVAARLVVSTDSPQIGAIALEEGAEVIHRPRVLAADASSTEAVLLHALDVFAAEGFSPDALLTLPPTAPLRTARTIQNFVRAFETQGGGFDAMISLTENREYYWMRGTGGAYVRLFPNAPRRRQERTPLYAENSALYLTRSRALRESGSILGRSVTGYPLDPVEALDINEPIDLAWAEFLLRQRGLAQGYPPNLQREAAA